MLIATGDDYPPGTPGEIAVCYFLRSEASWFFDRVKDRAEADAEFRKALSRDDVLSVVLERGPHAGRTSRVVWIAECDGIAWLRIKETNGATQYMEVWE